MDSKPWDFEFDEWNPNKTSFIVHMVAGSCGGMMEHCVLFPVDSVKTHLQASAVRSNRVINVVRDLVKEGGPLRLWRGMSPMVAACIPAHSLYFGLFENLKRRLGGSEPGHHPLAVSVAGAVGMTAHDAIMVPFDVCKQRMQLGRYAGMGHAFKTIVRTEGAGALFAAFPTTLLMNIPYSAVMVSINESLKTQLNPSGEQNVPVFLAAGSVAGACAAAVTCPIDVVKTRLQTQTITPKWNTLAARISLGVSSTVRAIYNEEGARGFVRGMRPRVLFHMPSVAICWTTYESVKRLLQQMQEERERS